MNDADRIDVPVVVRVEISEIHDCVYGVQRILNHTLRVRRIFFLQPAAAAGVVGFRVRQRDPGSDRALKIEDAVGVFVECHANRAGRCKDRVRRQPVEQVVVVGRRAGVCTERMIRKLA